MNCVEFIRKPSQQTTAPTLLLSALLGSSSLSVSWVSPRLLRCLLAGYCDSQLTDLQEICFGMFLPFPVAFILLLSLFSILCFTLLFFSLYKYRTLDFYKNKMVFMLLILLLHDSYEMTISNFLCRYKTSRNMKVTLCVFVFMNSCACHWGMGVLGILWLNLNDSFWKKLY